MPRSSSAGASTATDDASPRQSKSPSRKSSAAATVDVSLRPSWANPTFALTSMAQVHATLGNASLLHTFFERLEQICILIESLAHNANTELARDMIARSRLNVLLYGRSGSGKSTLIGTLTNNTEDGQGSTNLHSIGEQAVTTTVTNYATACGIHFTDRPGIDIPGAQAQNAEGSASVEQMAPTSSLQTQTLTLSLTLTPPLCLTLAMTLTLTRRPPPACSSAAATSSQSRPLPLVS